MSLPDCVRFRCFWLLLAVSSGQGMPAGALQAADRPPPFNRQILPILSEHCFPCHGPDSAARQGNLRLDLESASRLAGESGRRAIVPGEPAASELVRRVESSDSAERMPPADFPKSLSDHDRQLLREWIAAGAAYERHWALQPMVRPNLPQPTGSEWARTPIDLWVLQGLADQRLSPSADAEPATLWRRLSLDLTGLPPTPVDAARFVEQMRGAAARGRAEVDRVYATWVDRLLASPHLGERMAVDWLDAARYADTNGYQVDRDREMYAWRDWVIAAFNAGMPFDQFTIEQLAGDLLPNPSLEQRIATGFHRNHMLNEEGGVIPEEFLAEYCADRVETTATVWLGQTFQCARCHDHKYDPFTQRDYYGLYAFFHNVPEKGIGNYGASIRRNAPPQIPLPAPDLERRLAELRDQERAVRRQQAERESRPDAENRAWETSISQPAIFNTPGSLAVELKGEGGSPDLARLSRGAHNASVRTQWTGPALRALRIAWSVPAGDAAAAAGEIHLSRLKAFLVQPEASEKRRPLELKVVAEGDSLELSAVEGLLEEKPKTGAVIRFASQREAAVVVAFPAVDSWPTSATIELEFLLRVVRDVPGLQFQVSGTSTSPDRLASSQIRAIVQRDPATRTDADRKLLREFRLSLDPEYQRGTERLRQLAKQQEELELQIPTALVMEELAAPRETRVLMRGVYDKPGEVVAMGTPAMLTPWNSAWPRNRLGLAQWLTDPANPLPARVTVNRFWQAFFGQGLVRSAEDFGTQGDRPTHPELLDWLADEFVRSGWDVKRLLRLIVLSSTYRQDARRRGEGAERDPENRWLSRGPRFRLQAEFIRDQALLASGLLEARIGGPSVKPYHPPGLYEQVSTGPKYTPGTGVDLYRRGMYTYWKRSVPPPSLYVFDAPFRETCTVRRPRTNTPLQSLNLLNDPTYVEAARFLGHRMLTEGGESPAARIIRGYELVLGRPPQPAELHLLVASLERTTREFQADPVGVQQLLSVGERHLPEAARTAELAAYTVVASTILNLDEAVTKE